MREKTMNLNDWGIPGDYRPRQFASLWQDAQQGWKEQLGTTLERNSGSNQPSVFFRADDIGAGGRAFEALCMLFRRHEVPLAMAVVPAWLSDIRKKQLFESAPLDEPLWAWHQHGWRHVNWQRTGKKSEFGEQRPFEKQMKDISQGNQKMEDLFGDHLIKVFTPPWNRLSASTLKILQELNFSGVSLAGPFPRGVKPSVILPNLRVQIDLHTRKAKDGASDFRELLDELASVPARKEPVGIMIHHHRMTRFAFEFLDELLHLLKRHAGTRLLSFREILDRKDAE